MTISAKKLLLAATIFGAWSFAYGQANPYPSRSVQIITTASPGGNPDVVARVLAQKLSERLGKPFVVENRLGFGGNIGAEKLATSPPDGYTLAVLDSSHVSINPTLYKKLTFSPVKDLAPVVLVATVPTLLVVNPGVPANSLQQFIAYAKANPGKLNYGSAGNGSIHHLTMAMFASRADIKMTHVPFKGGGEIVPPLIAGDIQAAFMGFPSQKAVGTRGRVLAISTSQRSKLEPDVPAVSELGLPGFNVAAKIGLFVPSATPEAIKALLYREASKILAEKDVQDKLRGLGMETQQMTTEAFAKELQSDFELYGKAVRDSGLAID